MPGSHGRAPWRKLKFLNVPDLSLKSHTYVDPFGCGTCPMCLFETLLEDELNRCRADSFTLCDQTAGIPSDVLPNKF